MPEIPRIRRIIVDLELDDNGARALAWSHRLARPLQVPIEAWLTITNASTERSSHDERAFEQDTLEVARTWLSERGIGVDAIHVASGSSDVELIKTASDGDIVVLGVDETEGLSGWALGSRSHLLAHNLRCPLVVVPPSPVAQDDGPIVVGDDGSDANTAVIAWAKGLADDLNRPLVSVFAYSPFYDTFDNAGDFGAEEHRAHASTDAIRADLAELPGTADDVLRDFAVETSAFLTIVGARQQHSLGGLLLGHVVDHLLHHPPRAVAVVTHAALHS